METRLKRVGILFLMLFSILQFSNAYSQACAGDPNSMTLDDDGDGYKNGDETQNLTDKCSAASIPYDFDGDFTSDLLDADDDNDGISDLTDKFAQDANNGTTTTIPVLYNYTGVDNGGIRGWGFTGLMNNGSDYMNLFSANELTVGGAAKKFKVDNVPANDALGATNNQKYAFQFGVNTGAFPFSFVVNGRVMAPFDGLTPLDFRSMGIFMGTGDQDNYLKMVCAANGGAGGIEIVKEVAGVSTSTMYPVSILGSTHVNLYLTVNPATNIVQPSYSVGGGAKTNMGPAISVPASWINNVMAAGIISTSRGATPFPATWDYIAVQPVESAGDWVNVNTNNTCNARFENAFVQAGTKFYLLGGRGTKPVDIYNYGTKTWSTGATPPMQLHHFQAVELNGLIYAVCAFTGNLPNETPIANVYIYDPVANVWHIGMEIPEARRRGAAGAVAYNGKIYIVGGLTNGHVNGWVPYVDEFNPETNTWTTLPDAPHTRDHFQMALHGDKLYCIGGRNTGFGGSTYANTVAETDIYDISDQSWSTLASPEGDIPTMRAGCSAATMGDEIIIIGGESMAQSGSHIQTEALNVTSNTWRTLDDLNTGRHSTQALVSNFGIYTAAGCGSRGTTPELNSLEAFYLYGNTNPTGTSITKGALAISPGNLNFGSVNLGSTNTQTVTITNPSGNQALLIKVFQLAGGVNYTLDFPLSKLPVALSPGESLTVDIKFTPASLGTKNATFSVTHNGTNGANTIINLTGEGTSPQNSPQGYLTSVPASVVFPPTDVNVISTPITVSLTNTGGAALTINSASISGTNASDFVHNFSGPMTVGVGSTQTFNVTFTPSAAGARSATLTVNHSGVNSPLNISLSGTGTSTTAACGYYTEQNGLLVVEIESAPASDGWTPETYYPNYTGTEYYTWNGPRYLHEKGHGMLTYQFEINDPGKYRFKMRTRNGGPLNTHNNDVWVRFPDHGVTFEKNGAVVQDQSGWWKAWQNNLGVWTYNTWAGESTFWEIYVTFPFAGVYTFEISGRDQLYSMDRWVLYKPDMMSDWAATVANPPASPWENCPVTPLTWYRDKDLDYYGNPNDSIVSASKPGVGWSLNKTDCDDNSKSVYPGAPEILDGRDNDCDGVKDEGAYLSSLSINCGGSQYISVAGDTFTSDRLYTPLSSSTKYYNGIGDVLNSDDDNLFKSERSVGAQNNYLSYNFQCTSPGAYSVKLYFAETGTVSGAGQRVFDVYINDSLYLNDLDIYATAGYMTALTYSFNLPVFDGQLDIKFVDQIGKAKINAIQVAKIPNTPPTFTVSGTSTYNEDFTGTNYMTVVPGVVPPHEASWQTTTYSISPASVAFANVSINPSTGLVSITAVPNMNGQQQFTITANDGQPANNTATKTFTLKVLAVNDAPSFTLSGNITVDEDFAGTQTVSATPDVVPADEASQVVTYSLSPASVAFANVSINSSTGAVSINAVADKSGSQVFTVTANDGQSTNNTATQTFTLTVNEVNDIPTMNAIADITIDEDASMQTVNLSGISAGGNESQTLSVSAVSDNASLIANPSVNYTSANATGSLSFAPAADKSGSAHITVTVSDGSLTFSKMFTVTVNPVNDAPVFTLSGNVSVSEDFASAQHVTVAGGTIPADETSQSVSYSLSPASVAFANVSINATTGEVTITSVANAAGSQLFTVTANDGQSQNNTYTQTFMLKVNVVNDAPVFTLSGDVNVSEDFASAQHVTVAAGTIPADEMSQSVSYSLSPASVAFASVSINAATGEVTITSVANANGSQLFTVTADDGQSQNNTHSQTFTLTVNAVNDAPVFTLSGDVNVSEDFVSAQHVTVAAGMIPADEMSQSVFYSLLPASVAFASVSINAATGEVTITSVANASGTQLFTVTANDGQSQNNTHAQTFTLTVNAVNDAPVFTLSGDVNVNEDFTSTEQVTVSVGTVPADEMSQSVSYSLSPASVSFANVSINSATGEVTITSVANASGSQLFTVTADDGQSQNNTYSQTFTLTVNAVNDAPVFTLSGDISVLEGVYTSATETVYPGFVPADEMSQTVSYSIAPASVSFANISINSTTGEVTITPVADQFGSQLFTITANDGQSQNNTHSQTFTLNVDEGNNPPSFTLSGDVTVDEDFATAQHVTVTPDAVRPHEAGQVVTYSLSPASVSFANVSFNSATGEVTLTSIADAHGSQQFTITADDGESRNNLYSKNFLFTVNPVNDAPVFTLSGDVTVAEDFATAQHVTVSAGMVPADELSQTVSYALSPASVAFASVSINSSTGEVTITAVADASGSQLFTITADDGQPQNNPYAQTFTLTVNEVNDQPTLDAIANPAAIFEDDGINYLNLTGISAGGSENQSLSVSVSSDNPSLLSSLSADHTNPNSTAVLSYAPASNQWGSATITVTVDDGQSVNNTVTRTFVITVNPVNDAPEFALSQGVLTLDEDFAGTQTVSVVPSSVPADEMPQTVAYSLSPASVPFANISFNSMTGEMQITAVANASGTRTFTVLADDGQSQNNTHSQTFVLTINAVNDAPVFTVNPSATVSKNFTSSVTFTVTPGMIPTDEVSQTVTYSLSPATVPFATVTFNSANGTVVFTSVNNMTGSQQFTLTADDAQSVNNLHSEQFVFSVVDTNYQPSLDAIADVTINEDAGMQTISLSGISSGFNENQPVAVSAVSNNPALIPNPAVSYTNPNATGSLSFTPVANQSGTAVITVKVDDGQSINNFITRSFTVTVNAVNDAPEMNVISDLTINEDAGIQDVMLSGISAGPDEAQTLVISVVSDNSSLIATPAVMYTSPDATGMLHFAPEANQNGSAVITVTVNDGQSSDNTITKSFTVTVLPVNDAPVIDDVYKYGQEDKNIGFAASNFTDKFSDIENDAMSKIKIVSLPHNGALLLNLQTVNVLDEITAGDIANLVYDPADEFSGVDSFAWNGADGQLYAAMSAMVYLNVNDVNDRPVIVNPIADITVNEDAAPMLNYADLGAVFHDIEDGSNMTYSVVNSNLSLLDVVVDTDHTLDISFHANAHGSAMIIVTAADHVGAAVADTFSVTVNSVEDIPNAFNLLTPVDGSVIDPSYIEFTWENSTDGDGDAVTYSVSIEGADLDTTLMGISVNSILFNGLGLKPGNTYQWFAAASDGDDVKLSQTFSFKIQDGTGIGNVNAFMNKIEAYPNPFSAQISIGYTLKADAHVTVTIYDFLGQVVHIAVSEKQFKGEHKVDWKGAANVSSGMYIYEIAVKGNDNTTATFTGKIVKE